MLPNNPYPLVVVAHAAPTRPEECGVLEWDDASQLDQATSALARELGDLSGMRRLASVLAVLSPAAVLSAAVAGTVIVNAVAGLGAALMSLGLRVLIFGSLRMAIDEQVARVAGAHAHLVRRLEGTSWLMEP